MANSNINPNLLSLITTGWVYIQDTYWLLTAEGAKAKVTGNVEHLVDATAWVANSPAVNKRPPPLPKDVEPTLEKISNIMQFTIPTCHYVGKACFYAATGAFACHVLTRFFSTFSLLCFLAATFFEALKSDLRELEMSAEALQRKFELILGEKGSLKKISIPVKVEATKNHIQDTIHEVQQLSKSLYLIQYILGGAIRQTESHLLGLDQRIHSEA